MRPLEGIVVLDLTRLLPGAVATMLLREYGAEVIKIEQPGSGDYARTMAPLIDGEGVLFRHANVGKKSVALDLKSEAGRESLLRLCQRADVLVEGFRPGVMERLGLGWDALAAHAPRLVYASLTGYPRDSGLAHEAGHDLNYMASEGLLGWPPRVPPYLAADICGGSMQLVAGILAALVARERTGRGSRVDVAMTSGLAVLALAPRALGAATRLDGSMPCYALYVTADHQWVAVAALEPRFWREFCDAAGQSGWIERQFDAGLVAVVAEWFGARESGECMRRFAGRDTCASLVRCPFVVDPPSGKTPALGEDDALIDSL